VLDVARVSVMCGGVVFGMPVGRVMCWPLGRVGHHACDVVGREGCRDIVVVGPWFASGLGHMDH
jgi:hypothetical protein